MKHEPYPSADDLRTLAGAHDLIASRGVAAGPRGYDLATLAAAVYANGWAYGIDRTVGAADYRAEIRVERARTHRSAGVGIGWTPEAALAIALAQALALALPRS